MQASKKSKIDPGFWVGLVLIAFLIFCTIKCKQIMLKGQIVRKCLSSGEPIGSYYIITGFSGKNRSLVRLESVDGVITCYVKREQIKEYSITRMIIGHRVFERIEKGLQTSIIHDATPKWEKMYKKEPDIVQLRDELYSNKIMSFHVEEIKKVFYSGSVQIRLELGVRML